MVKAVKAMKRSIEEIGYNIISIRELVSGLMVYCYFIYIVKKQVNSLVKNLK
jgi:hypothetical protein